MRFAAIAGLFIFMPALCRGETLKMRSGQEQSAKVLAINADSVLLEGSAKPVDRKAVLEIQFAAPKDEAALSASAIAPTEQDRHDAAAAFASAKELGAKFPGVNGLILLDHGEYIYNPDGSTLTRSHEVRQILKESLKQSWGQAVICGEEGRDRVRITKASVYTPDGKIYPLDPAKIQTVHPQDASGEFFNSGEVCAQYSMPNVQVGSIVDYIEETEEYNPFRRDFFFPEWGFQDMEGPVKLSEVSITMPAGKELYFATRNFPSNAAQVARTATDKTTTWHWKLENVAPLVPEPMMPAAGDVMPFLHASSLKNWDLVFDWMYNLYTDRTKPSGELRAFTLNLVKDCKTDTEKATKIYHYVQKEIRYIALKVGVASGTGGYDANLTWKRGWGCCVDKSLLLTTMLQTAGIKASPIIINTNDQTEVDFRIPHLEYDHSITVAEIDGKHVFLDSTNFDYRYPEIASFDYGVNVINAFDRKIDFVPVPNPEDNASHYDYELAIAPNGDTAVKAEMHYTGSREGGLRDYYRSIKKEEQEMAFQHMSKGVASSAELTSWHVDNAENIELPFGIGMGYMIKDYPKRAGNILIFTLPDFAMDTSRTAEVSQDKRIYPISYRDSLGRYYSYHLTLPPNYKVISLPKEITLKTAGSTFNAGCKQESAASVVCHVKWERPVREIAAGDYADYKKFLEEAASYTKNQLFFKDTSAIGSI